MIKELNTWWLFYYFMSLKNKLNNIINTPHVMNHSITYHVMCLYITFRSTYVIEKKNVLVYMIIAIYQKQKKKNLREKNFCLYFLSFIVQRRPKHMHQCYNKNTLLNFYEATAIWWRVMLTKLWMSILYSAEKSMLVFFSLA